jgi:hypothetical protein
MTVDDTRVTIGESYGLATHSSNLRVQEKRTDADMIMAAGMVAGKGPVGGHDLGVLLLRLHSEFDTARGALMRVDQEMPRYLRAAAALDKRADTWHPGLRSDPEALRADAASLRHIAKRRAVSESLLVLMELKTVRPARQALYEYTEDLAQKERFREPSDVLQRIANRTLDVLLDPTCHTCWGTGSEGSGYLNETMRVCITCGGSGHRRDSIGNGPRARWFAFILLGNMQQEMAHAAGGIGRMLRSEA